MESSHGGKDRQPCERTPRWWLSLPPRDEGSLPHTKPSPGLSEDRLLESNCSSAAAPKEQALPHTCQASRQPRSGPYKQPRSHCLPNYLCSAPQHPGTQPSRVLRPRARDGVESNRLSLAPAPWDVVRQASGEMCSPVSWFLPSTCSGWQARAGHRPALAGLGQSGQIQK